MTGPAYADTININAPNWLGNYHLQPEQLQAIRAAIKKALNAPIDADQQCGEERMDCVVRAARQWQVDGEVYREIVVYLHTIGHTSHAIGQTNGRWPEIAIK